MSLNLALKVNDLDNVATIFANGITDGTIIEWYVIRKAILKMLK